MRKTPRCCTEDAKIFVGGTRMSGEEEKASKLICEKIVPFDEARKELWIQFPDPAAYQEKAAELMPMMPAVRRAAISVVIYVEKRKADEASACRLTAMSADDGLIEQLVSNFWQREM